MKRLLTSALLLALPADATADPPAGDRAAVKEALQALQEFIGEWRATGGPDKPRPGPTDPTWQETLRWAWRFKGDDAWLTLEVAGGKVLKSGELRYLPAKKKYQLTAADPDGGRRVFEGDLKDDVLKFERTDPATKEVQQVTMTTAAEGVRFIYRVGHKPAGSTLLRKDFLVAATKEGESLAAKDRRPECVVSGGLGTIAVSYKGETYYVCCSGCRDAFNEEPEKYIAEWKAKKAGKK
jgi:hypothetical protein